jgi:hypothetical protein
MIGRVSEIGAIIASVEMYEILWISLGYLIFLGTVLGEY